VLLMRELSGLEFAEIGAAYDTSAAAARQTLYEARLGLRALEEGRERRCADVRRELSDSDGRVGRRLKIRAHLRSCPECRAFGEAIGERRDNLAALAPLPAGAALGLLRSLLGGGGSGSGSGGAGGGLGAALSPAAQTLAVPAAVKSAAAVAVVAAAIGAGAADRAHLIDLPLGGRSGGGVTAHRVGPQSGGQDLAGDAQEGRSARAAGGHGAGKRSASAHAIGHRPVHPDAADDGSSASPGSASPGPRSEGGETPPGGGFGRSAAETHGAPASAPPAAEHGLQTSASHKPPPAPSSPPAEAGRGAAPPAGQTPPADVPAAPPAGGQPSSTPAAPEAPAPGAPAAAEPPGRSGAEVAAEAKNRP